MRYTLCCQPRRSDANILCLRAAQRDPAAAADGKLLAIADGEYTLVYEDDEGDRMLVGDVPWK
jgi:auxin-responsive protein IAA